MKTGRKLKKRGKNEKMSKKDYFDNSILRSFLEAWEVLWNIIEIVYTSPAKPRNVEPTIPDKSHICRQFCHICRIFPQTCRQFRHLGEIVSKYGSVWTWGVQHSGVSAGLVYTPVNFLTSDAGSKSWKSLKSVLSFFTFSSITTSGSEVIQQ